MSGNAQAALADLLARAGFTDDQAQELQWHRIRWPLMSEEEFVIQGMNSLCNGPSDEVGRVPDVKNRQLMTHVGIITECYQPREVRLRETSTWWVSECGLRFRKTTGAAVGSGVWSANRLDLKSIREIQSGE